MSVTSYRNRTVFLLLLMIILPFTKTTATYQAPNEIPINVIPKNNYKIIQGEVTKYSSEIGQTDNSPFITANGDYVGHGTIACPGNLPFGTIVEIVGVKYTCNDRMSERYRSGNYFDVWTDSTAEAMQWGRQQKEIIIYD